MYLIPASAPNSSIKEGWLRKKQGNKSSFSKSGIFLPEFSESINKCGGSLVIANKMTTKTWPQYYFRLQSTSLAFFTSPADANPIAAIDLSAYDPLSPSFPSTTTPPNSSYVHTSHSNLPTGPDFKGSKAPPAPSAKDQAKFESLSKGVDRFVCVGPVQPVISAMAKKKATKTSKAGTSYPTQQDRSEVQ